LTDRTRMLSNRAQKMTQMTQMTQIHTDFDDLICGNLCLSVSEKICQSIR
jgi:hypothetical protein